MKLLVIHIWRSDAKLVDAYLLQALKETFTGEIEFLEKRQKDLQLDCAKKEKELARKVSQLLLAYVFNLYGVYYKRFINGCMAV